MPYDGVRGRWPGAGVAFALAFSGAPAVPPQPATTPPPCARRVMQLVAHTDDDLLFLNPDIQDDVDRGRCVRTVYLTAGDSGLGARYWARREAGVLAAYATMAAAPNRWSAGDVPGTPVRLRTLVAHPNVSLVFLRLPDGARRGDGFARTGGGSLRKLWEGGVARLTTVDAPPAYTKEGLIATLAGLMAEFRPDTVRVQEPGTAFEPHHDHSDHQAAARFATAAGAAYAGPHELVRYAGYVTTDRPPNVSGADLRAKKAAFYAYGHYDRRACDSDRTCTGKYAGWLRRRYARAATPARTAGPAGPAARSRCAADGGGSPAP